MSTDPAPWGKPWVVAATINRGKSDIGRYSSTLSLRLNYPSWEYHEGDTPMHSKIEIKKVKGNVFMQSDHDRKVIIIPLTKYPGKVGIVCKIVFVPNPIVSNGTVYRDNFNKLWIESNGQLFEPMMRGNNESQWAMIDDDLNLVKWAGEQEFWIDIKQGQPFSSEGLTVF